MLTADLATALTRRSIRVTWMAAASSAVRSRAPSAPAQPTPQVRRIRIDMPEAPAPPVNWQVRENTVADAIISALRDLPSIDVIHLTHFSRSGLEFLDRPPICNVPTVATLTDYTAVCGDYQLVHRQTGNRCGPPVLAETCAACVGARSTHQVSAQNLEMWRRRNLSFFSGRCRALWMQTPHQRLQMRNAGLRDDHVISDHAAYAIPLDWRSRPPSADQPTFLFLGRASAEKGLHVLLQAFMAWRKVARLVVCSAADDTAYEDGLRRVASTDMRIDWRDPVPRNDLVELLNDAHALVVPSQWEDNHPMVMQYALALGVPVLCSGVASLMHLAGQDGLFTVDRYWDVARWTSAFEGLISQSQIPFPDRLAETRRAYDAHVDSVVRCYRLLAGAA